MKTIDETLTPRNTSTVLITYTHVQLEHCLNHRKHAKRYYMAFETTCKPRNEPKYLK